MKKDILSHIQHPVFDAVKQASHKLGQKTYVIGGYVRDIFLDRPNKDIDFVTIGNGIELAQEAANLLPDASKVAYFKNFGTAHFIVSDIEVEFVGARRESYRRDSRKPIVEDGTLEEDQLRRDFTINALGLSVNSEDFGALLDPFDGVSDIESRIIKTPLDPEQTFSDDPLRMMRAIRFASQLGFDIFPSTFEAIKSMADRISIVSMERITDELNKIILSPKPSYGFKLLNQSGLLDKIFPEFVKLKGVETQDGKGHKDNFYHTLQVLDNISEKTSDLWLRWAAVLHDIAKPATKKFHPKVGWTFHGHEDLGARWVKSIFTRMRLPLDEKMRSVSNLVRLHLRPIALAKVGVTDAAIRRLIVEAGDDLEGLMLLCRADITSKDQSRVSRYLKNFDKVEELLFEVREKDKLREFQPVFTGEYIMKLFQIPPSREVGLLKTLIRESILDCKIENTLEESYTLVVQNASEMGFKPLYSLEELLQS
ncbi:MAG: CCA tRNA nucleotidyltransferase [Leadbetterella sp.]